MLKPKEIKLIFSKNNLVVIWSITDKNNLMVRVSYAVFGCKFLNFAKQKQKGHRLNVYFAVLHSILIKCILLSPCMAKLQVLASYLKEILRNEIFNLRFQNFCRLTRSVSKKLDYIQKLETASGKCYISPHARAAKM